jgi:cell wall-associated NlpC family hydrolase
VVGLALLPGASADPDDDDTLPSKERVHDARDRVRTTADRVDAIERRLGAADRRLQSLSLEAGKAVEAYNGARYQLREARKAVRRAERAAAKAAARLSLREDQLASAIVADFEGGGSLANLSILLEDPDPTALLEKLDAYAAVTGALQSDRVAYRSAKADAEVKEDRAEKAAAEQEAATEAAEAAKEAAEAAVERAQSAVSTIADEKDVLIRRLAQIRNISVTLAQQRQQELAERAAERAAERSARQARRERREQEQSEPEPDRPSHDDPSPGEDPPPANDPAPSNGVRAAIQYAKAQIGEPYVYGADGPDEWDCSGLTMRAWAAAGESLSHWSVAQYRETTPIAFSDLRRGDLLFWGESDDPDTIYHVAMYLGGDMMIHAPSPGNNVEIVSMYYWILPNLYTRV